MRGGTVLKFSPYFFPLSRSRLKIEKSTQYHGTVENRERRERQNTAEKAASQFKSCLRNQTKNLEAATVLRFFLCDLGRCFPFIFPFTGFQGGFSGGVAFPAASCLGRQGGWKSARAVGFPAPRQGSKSASACRFVRHPGNRPISPGERVRRSWIKKPPLTENPTTVGLLGMWPPVSESDTRAAAAPAGVPPKFCGYLRCR